MGYVLVVDDMPAVREPLALVLQRTGFPTKTAENGSIALDLIDAERPDVVVLDLMMPVMDGLSVLRSLRSRKKTADLPVIVMTGSSDRENVLAAGRLGVRDYLVKSQFQLTDLVERIGKYVKAGEGGSQAGGTAARED